MRAHLAAARALLAPLGYPVHDTAVLGSSAFPYLILWGSSSGNPGSEPALDAERTDIDEVIGLTSVALTADGVRIAATRARGLLTPAGRPGRLVVAGQAVWLRLEDSRPVEVDRDVTLPTSNQHPFFGVDLYRLTSTPA